MSRVFAWGVLATVFMASAYGGLLLLPASEPSAPITLWEAYARGNATVVQVLVTYDRGGYEVTIPVGYKVTNTGSVNVVIDEPAMLMSPAPAQFVVDPSDPTTQDGALTPGVVAPGSSLTYYYADEGVQGYLPEPYWWCTEQYQFTQDGVAIVLGGEILPFVLQDLTENPYHDSEAANTQMDLWNHLKEYPTVVVGKTPLWKTMPNTAGQEIPVVVTATNIAVRDDGDGFDTDPDADDVVVRDVIPAGWTVVPGSWSMAPTSQVDNADGSKTVEWVVDISAADVTDHPDASKPSGYNGVRFRYKLESPRLDAGRVPLPRAEVDTNGDGTVDAHSAIPVLDVFRVNIAPTAVLDGPVVVTEGTPFALDAGGSFDPDGDAMTFRWDMDSDGSWDTEWSSDPLSPVLRFGDDASGTVTVEVSDGELQSQASVAYVVENAPPAIVAIVPDIDGEGTPATLTVTFTDAGWLDTHVAFVDWGEGTMETFPLETSHDPPFTVGEFSLTRTYGDDFDYPVTFAVVDDDLGTAAEQYLVPITNLAPSIVEVHATATATFGLRVAGEKWHDVRLTLTQNGEVVGSAGVVRMPGSPDEQSAWVGEVTVDLTGDFEATIEYTPDDDPVNGRPNGDNPVWLVLRFDDGTEARLKHNFNVQHEDTWTWSVRDILPLFAGQEIDVSARATDPGSDDLTFAWDFGDGTVVTETAYNNGVSPDARPSADGLFPFEAVSGTVHVYADGGRHSITLVVRDDDGGSATVVLVLGM